jgi:hypothetical protein
MQEQRFDTLVKTIGDQSGSRRRALQVVGAALTSAGLLSRFSAEATAGSAKKRCKQAKGVYLSAGECHCAQTCAAGGRSCNGDATCQCQQAANGTGFCAAQQSSYTGADCVCNGCPAGKTCVALPGCLEAGQACNTVADCRAILGSGYGCINGHCQETTCVDPCPTQP